MKHLAFLKVLILVVALAIVFQIMHNTTANSVSRMLGAIGIEAGGAQSPGLHPAAEVASADSVAFNLCPTRIHELAWADGRVIEESKDGMKSKWLAGESVARASPLREISPLDMEKWLSRHCQIQVEPHSLKVGETVAFKPLVKVVYIDQASAELFRSDSGLYRLGEKVFSSLDLNRAISELTQVANFTKAANVP